MILSNHKYIIAVVLLISISLFIFLFFNRNTEVVSEYYEAGIEQTDKPDNKTKKTFLGGEIPVSWSEFNRGEAPLYVPYYITEISGDPDDFSLFHGSILHSFSTGPVTYSDANFEQVDFRLISETVRDAILEHATEDPRTDVQTKLIDDVNVSVIKYPTDENENYVATKAAPGSTYYIAEISNNGDPANACCVLIEQQSRGSGTFERNFQHYIDSVNFADVQKKSFFELRYE